MATSYCSHPDAPASCSRVIGAHTIQRRGGLAAIAEDGHVVCAHPGFRNLDQNEGRLVPGRVGVRSASTFSGYCSFHDNALFRPVEVGEEQLSRDSIFLLSMRASALELFRKVEAINGHTAHRDNIDRGRPFPLQAWAQERFAHILLAEQFGRRDAEKNKAKYDFAFARPDRGSFGYYFVEFEDAAPIVACGGVAPLTTVDGRPIQDLGQADLLDMLTVNFTILGGRSVLCLGWMQPEGPAEQFAQSFAALAPDRKSRAAGLLSVRCIENTYYRPSWYASLSEEGNQRLVREMKTFANEFVFDRGDLTNEPVGFVSPPTAERSSFPDAWPLVRPESA